MKNKTRQKRLSLPFLISLIIHLGLIFLLAYGAWNTLKVLNAGDQGQSIEAKIVDPQRQAQYLKMNAAHQNALKEAAQQQKERAEKQQKALKEAKIAEQKRVKALEKERIRAEQETKKRIAQEKEAQKKADLAKQKQAEAQKKAELNAEKTRQETQALKEKLAAEQKAAQEKQEKQKQQEKAQQAAQQKNAKTVDSLIDDILANPNASKAKGDVDTSQYSGLVAQVIQSRFYNPNEIYSGKTCQLKIHINEQGAILSLAALKGDSQLCNEAMRAAKAGNLPKPTAEEYAKVKELIIDFVPR